MPNPLSFEDDSVIPTTTVSLSITQTSKSLTSMNSDSAFQPDAITDLFVAETSVLGFFQENDGLSGGPPALLSMYDGALSLVTKATKSSVIQEMIIVSSELDGAFSEENIDTHCLMEVLDSSTDNLDDDSVDIDDWFPLFKSGDYSVGVLTATDLQSRGPR